MNQAKPVVDRYNGADIASRIRQEISQKNWKVIGPKLLGTTCVFILGGILVAGFWPFHAPKNRVTWLAAGNGLHFGDRGTILSSGRFSPAGAKDDAPCSFEVWVEPEVTAASGALFSFYAPGSHRQFSLHQSISDLALRSDTRDDGNEARTTWLYVDNIFRRGKPLFITVTSDGARASVYVDGVLVRTPRKFPLSAHDFDGELVVANFPHIDNSWSGALRGLAFYNQNLNAAQVRQHFATWTSQGQPEASGNERAVALYLFNEHAGRVIHNQAPTGINLYIPDRYQVLDQVFLSPFWKESEFSWAYWQDVLVNITGFVPFGFLFCAYFALAARFKRPALVTILFGFMVSLTIESLQVFLPTRDSDSTDIVTNVLGTCLGVWLYQSKLWRRPFAKIWAYTVENSSQERAGR